MEYIDVHAHYDDDRFVEDLENELEIVRKSGVKYIINAGSSIENSKKAINLALNQDFIYCTVGIHPECIDEIDRVNEVEKLYNENKTTGKIVAIGEIGLDYHYDNPNKEKQIELFKKQIQIAKKLDLPIQIHSRDAVEDMIKIIKNEDELPNKIMFHCYELNEELTKIIIQRGYSISLGGNITYKRKESVKEQIKRIPLKQIMLETDSPYLAPQEVRGTRNSSKNLKYVAQEIAKIKGISIEEVVRQTYKNACEFYNICK
ncbi:MAG: TatD family hydrolase [Clostridia bacterium]|nr:TatD family hydrolase [Clostridia bacterium]